MTEPRKKTGAQKTAKKTTTKKITTKKVEVDAQEEQENQRFVELIETVRGSSVETDINKAFEDILDKLKPRIQRMVNRFSIKGLDSSDVMQEALFALRYKAIKDYDETRGTTTGVAPFDRFALLCIRRHLSTEFKSSLQNNRKKVLNQSISLDQENKGNDDELALINILPADEGSVLEIIQEQEYYQDLMSALVKTLSQFEKEVLVLYAQRFTYEEIAAKINEKRVKIRVNVKGVDNALSRVKNKAKAIFAQYEQDNPED